MDISPSYNCLLGRPWIHIAGAVPSILHQKIMFVTEGQLISIVAEEDMIAATSSGAPYVETYEKEMKCSFKSLEFVNTMYVGERTKILVPKLLENTHLVDKSKIYMKFTFIYLVFCIVYHLFWAF